MGGNMVEAHMKQKIQPDGSQADHSMSSMQNLYPHQSANESMY